MSVGISITGSEGVCVGNVVIDDREQPERDETFVGRMTQIDSDCRRGGVDMRPVRDEVAAVVDAAKVLRDSAAAADMNLRQRRVVADSIGKAIREGMD